jgi:hypothetical protein
VRESKCQVRSTQGRDEESETRIQLEWTSAQDTFQGIECDDEAATSYCKNFEEGSIQKAGAEVLICFKEAAA